MGFGYTNPNDNEGLTALISCGCHVVFFVTGRGSVVGSAVAPVFKITGNSMTYRNRKMTWILMQVKL
jgi:altronate hydrolase